MTRAERALVASRKALVYELMSKQGELCFDIPYDRIRTGEWEFVVDAVLPRNDSAEGHGDAGCVIELLACHARDYPGEVGLVPPLLKGLAVINEKFCRESYRQALFRLVEVTHPLSQHEVDILTHALWRSWDYFEGFQYVAEMGYAPSLGAENELLRLSGDDSLIRQMQPRWHAMRLRSEMRDQTPAITTSIEVRAGPGL